MNKIINNKSMFILMIIINSIVLSIFAVNVILSFSKVRFLNLFDFILLISLLVLDLIYVAVLMIILLKNKQRLKNKIEQKK